MRVTLTANRKIRSLVKFRTSASWLRSRVKEMNISTNPVSAVHIAKRKMSITTNPCHGRSIALVRFFRRYKHLEHVIIGYVMYWFLQIIVISEWC